MNTPAFHVSETASFPAHLLPFSEDAEKGVLCSLLLSPTDTASICLTQLPPQPFYIPAHQILYSLILQHAAAHKLLDFVTLRQALKDRGKLEEIGGPEYLSDLFNFVPTAENAPWYASIVRDKYQRRAAILECKKLQHALQQNHEDAPALLSRHGSAISDILALNPTEQKLFKERVFETLGIIEERSKTKTITGITFGLDSLDQHLYGVCPGRFYLISAGTSAGKTMLAGQAVLNAALQGNRVALFSLEMTDHEFIERMFANRANVPMHNLLRGLLEHNQYKRLAHACTELAALPIEFEDRFLRDADSIVARVRELHSREKLALVVVDYLQLIESVATGRNTTREQQISEATRKLLILTKELQVATIAMSQINDDGTLRDCRAIAFHSDVWLKIEAVQDQPKDIREIHIAKGRNIGQSTKFRVRANGQFMRFEDLD